MGPGKKHMSLNVFLALCIIGCDFLIYILYQWVFGEKYRAQTRRVAARNNAGKVPPLRPYMVRSRRPGRSHVTEREVT